MYNVKVGFIIFIIIIYGVYRHRDKRDGCSYNNLIIKD